MVVAESVYVGDNDRVLVDLALETDDDITDDMVEVEVSVLDRELEVDSVLDIGLESVD